MLPSASPAGLKTSVPATRSDVMTGFDERTVCMALLRSRNGVVDGRALPRRRHAAYPATRAAPSAPRPPGVASSFAQPVLALALAQHVDHHVERPPQRADLVPTRHAHVGGVVVAALERVGGVRERLDGPA